MLAGHERRHILEHRYVDRFALAGLFAPKQSKADRLSGYQSAGYLLSGGRAGSQGVSGKENRSELGIGGSASRCAKTTAISESPANGGSPTRHS